MPKQFIQPEGLTRSPAYTHVVTAQGGTLVFISGQIALNANGELVGRGDLRAQTIQVFNNLQTALAAAGASFNDVVKLNIYIVNYKPEDRAVLGEVRSQYLSKGNPPASTLIGVQSLAFDGLLIEIEATAVVESLP